VVFAYCVYAVLFYLVLELSYGLTSNSGICAQWLEVLNLWLKQSSHNGREFGKPCGEFTSRNK